MSKLLGDVAGKQCAFNDHGYRCQNDGHLSSTVYGEGPWYCRDHFARIMGWSAYRALLVDESQAAVDERINRIVPRRTDETDHDWSMRCRNYALDRIRQKTVPSKDWARRIIAKHGNGEFVYPYALELAREATAESREPGSDDELIPA